MHKVLSIIISYFVCTNLDIPNQRTHYLLDVVEMEINASASFCILRIMIVLNSRSVSNPPPSPWKWNRLIFLPEKLCERGAQIFLFLIKKMKG